MALPYDTPGDAEDAIARRGVKKAQENGRLVEYFSPEEIREAENARASSNAAGKNHFGLRFARLVPPSTG